VATHSVGRVKIQANLFAQHHTASKPFRLFGETFHWLVRVDAFRRINANEPDTFSRLKYESVAIHHSRNEPIYWNASELAFLSDKGHGPRR
jgi:hypothetical protein